MLVVFEVTSFSCFLFSSLVAQGLKIHISLLNSSNREDATGVDMDQRLLNFGVIGSVIGSVAGCTFLVLSMVNVFQIRVGLLSCGGQYVVTTSTTMIVMVSSAVLIYTYCVRHVVKTVYELLGGEDLKASNSISIELKEPELHS